MKTATVTAYINTGFSGINVPDSPALLENNAQRKQLSVINCLPLSGQVNVSIRVKDYPELHETDYIKMVFSGDNTTYWGKVDGYVYLSSDTVEISLTMDYWLTLGGIGNVSSISGMTKRVHIPKANDTLFAYTEPDEMINPAKPLKTVCDPDYDISMINPSPYPKDINVVLSTLDLYGIGRMYETDTDDNGNKIQNATVLDKDYTYTDPQTQSEVTEKKTITIPKLYSIGEIKYTNFTTKWGTGDDAISQTDANNADDPDTCYGILKGWVPNPNANDWYKGSEVDLTMAGIGYFNADDKYVKKGIAIVHDCGVEDCLLDQYKIPGIYVDMTGRTKIDFCGRINIHSAHNYSGLLSAGNNLNYEYGNHNVRNKKIFTGSCNAYTVYAKANSDMETFNPEIIESGNSEQSPIFRLIADLRHQGGAMISPLAVNKDFERWYMNFVKEMEFQSAPIKYEGASGRLLNEGQTYLSMNTASRNFQQRYPSDGLSLEEREQFIGKQINGLSNAFGGLANFLSGQAGTGIAQSIGGALDFAWTNTVTNDINNANAENRKALFGAQMVQEKMGMDLKNTYVAPQIKFQQSQTLRELVGNGFIIFKYQMTDEDLERCDRLLTMYGYRHSKVLEKTDLTNRPDFNYIEAGEVHITTNVAVPKWVREGAEDQLVGIRLWHKMFDISSYNGNE